MVAVAEAKSVGVLTRRQYDVLRYVVLYHVEHTRFPAIRSLKRLLKVGSTQGIQQHLEALERKGFLAHRGRGLGFAVRWDAVARLGMPTPTWSADTSERPLR